MKVVVASKIDDQGIQLQLVEAITIAKAIQQVFPEEFDQVLGELTVLGHDGEVTLEQLEEGFWTEFGMDLTALEIK